MRVYEVQPGCANLDGLCRAERPDPQPGPHEVLIRIRATSLNYRDHMIVSGHYFTPVSRPTIPLSDGAGEVAAVGPGVTRFQKGDRVAGAFFQVWFDGPPSRRHPALGLPLDGTLAEYIVLHEDGVVAIPANLSFEEAATLPCAGVTAWNALMVSGNPVKPGDTVLCLGTGGVSMLGMQFAVAAGARGRCLPHPGRSRSRRVAARSGRGRATRRRCGRLHSTPARLSPRPATPAPGGR